LFDNSNKKDEICIYDFGADVHPVLFNFAKTEIGKDFFSEIDYIFIPVKFDIDYTVSARNVLSVFSSAVNVKFIFCLTDYYGDVSIEFNRFFKDAKVLDYVYLLQATDRARIISIEHSKFIRDSNEHSITLNTLADSLIETKSECKSLIRSMNKKFDYAFLGFERNESKFSDFLTNDNENYRNYNSDFGRDLIKEVEKYFSVNENNYNSEKMDYVHSKCIEINESVTNLNKIINENLMSIESSNSTLSAFFSPDIKNITDEIKSKYQKNSLLIVSIFFLVFMLIPFGIFGIVGYRYGSGNKEVDARNKAEQQLLYANTFAKTLYETGALQSVSIHYDPIRNITSLVCDESLGKCLNRFDAANHISSIEFKGQSK
jgi:hypothetical protein